jgi:predicted enzyme related to lactoylglutathione lyase
LFGLTCWLEDIDAAAATAEKAGAEIVQPLMKIPDYGKFATFMQGGIHHGLW